MKNRKLRQYEPNDVPDSPLNDHPPLSSEEFSKLKKSILSTAGNTNPGFVWKGKTVCGKHRRKAILELNREGAKLKFQAYELPDAMLKDEVIDLIDQDNLVGRDYTETQKIDYIKRRFGDIIMMDNRKDGSPWKTEYKGKLYRNINVYISVRSGIPLRSVIRYRSKIRQESGVGKKQRFRELDPDTERTVQKWLKKYLAIEEKYDKLGKELAEIRENFKGLPGGFKRFYEEAKKGSSHTSKSFLYQSKRRSGKSTA